MSIYSLTLDVITDIKLYYVFEITLILEILTEEQIIGMLWGEVQFLFLFFPRVPHFETS